MCIPTDNSDPLCNSKHAWMHTQIHASVYIYIYIYIYICCISQVWGCEHEGLAATVLFTCMQACIKMAHIVHAFTYQHSSNINCKIHRNTCPHSRCTYVRICMRAYTHTHLQTQASTKCTHMHAYTQTSSLGPSHVYNFDDSLTQDLSPYGNNTLTATGSPQQTEGKVCPSVPRPVCLSVCHASCPAFCMYAYIRMYVCTCVYYIRIYVRTLISLPVFFHQTQLVPSIHTYVMLTCRSTMPPIFQAPTTFKQPHHSTSPLSPRE